MKLISKDPIISPDQTEAKLRNTDRFQSILVVFLVIFLGISIVTSLIRINKHKLDSSALDQVSITKIVYPFDFVSLTNENTNSTKKLIQFTVEDDYHQGEIVYIKHFNIFAFILEKSTQPSGNMFTVIYKDNDGVLQTTKIPKSFLLKPSKYVITPYSIGY